MENLNKPTPQGPEQDGASGAEPNIWDSLTNQPSWEERMDSSKGVASRNSDGTSSTQNADGENKETTYTEKPLEKVDFSGLPNIKISDSKNKNLHPHVNARKATSTDAEGDQQKSQVFLGEHDPVKMDLGNGEYVSAESMAEAIEASLMANPDNVTYVRHHETGQDESFAGQERADLAKKIVLEALDEKPSLVLSDNEKVTNQDAKLLAVRNEDAVESPAGSIFLGKKHIEMPNGYYLSAEEVQGVMEEYFMQIPTEEIVGGGGVVEIGGGRIDSTAVREAAREPEHQTVTKRREGFEKIATAIMVVIAALIAAGLLKSCTMPENYNANLPEPTPIESYEPDIARPMPDDIPAIEIAMPDETPPAPDEAMEQKNALDPSRMEIGSLLEAKAGVPYGEASDRAYDATADDTGEVGNQLPPGTYQVEAFSALVDGQIAKVSRQEGEKLSDFIARTSQELGIPEDQIEAQYHLVETGENQGEWVGWRGLNDAGDISLIETGEQ